MQLKNHNYSIYDVNYTVLTGDKVSGVIKTCNDRNSELKINRYGFGGSVKINIGLFGTYEKIIR